MQRRFHRGSFGEGLAKPWQAAGMWKAGIGILWGKTGSASSREQLWRVTPTLSHPRTSGKGDPGLMSSCPSGSPGILCSFSTGSWSCGWRHQLLVWDSCCGLRYRQLCWGNTYLYPLSVSPDIKIQQSIQIYWFVSVQEDYSAIEFSSTVGWSKGDLYLSKGLLQYLVAGT